MNKLTLPNLLSASRLLLAPLVAWQVLEAAWLVAALLLWVAIATDVGDGYLARRQNTTSAFGGFLDHGSDAVFVTLLLAAEAHLGLVPWLLPPLVFLAFSQYALDSRALAGQPLRASLLGRYNGILYFVLAGWPVMQHALGLYLLPNPAFYVAGWIMVTSTLVSMGDRALTLLRLRAGS